MTNEDQISISQWATDTFGDGGTDLHAAVRLLSEVAEFITVETSVWHQRRALDDARSLAEACVTEFGRSSHEDRRVEEETALLNDAWDRYTEELADVAIVMARLGLRLGVQFSFPTIDPDWGKVAPFAVVPAGPELLRCLANLMEALRRREVGADGPPYPVTMFTNLLDALDTAIAPVHERFQDAVNAKMAKNRKRWNVVGGHGQHVPGGGG